MEQQQSRSEPWQSGGKTMFGIIRLMIGVFLPIYVVKTPGGMNQHWEGSK